MWLQLAIIESMHQQVSTLQQSQTSLSIWGWGVLGILLFFATFGPFAIFYLAFFMFCILVGGLVTALFYGKTNSEKWEQSYLLPTQIVKLKILDNMNLEVKPIIIDKSLTGNNLIDKPLRQVIHLAMRDYIQHWYNWLSEDESFLLAIRQTLQKALLQLFTHSKEMEWQSYLTNRLVDDFVTHLRVFRKAQNKLAGGENKQIDMTEWLIDSFFEAEVEMEKKTCRDMVCTSRKEEENFLRDLSELLLYPLLSPGYFHNKKMRYLLREVLACGVLLPLINKLTDPDFINQVVIWAIQDSSCNYKAFIKILKMTNTASELEAVLDKLLNDLDILCSHDNKGHVSDKTTKQIYSFLFVKEVCETRIKLLNSGEEVDALQLEANIGKLCDVELDQILVNNIALQFFMDFMQVAGAQTTLLFWLSVEEYRVTALQYVEAMQGWQRDGKKQPSSTKGVLKANAMGVYEQYLSEKASQRVEVDEASLSRLGEALLKDDPTPEMYDKIQRKVYDIMLCDERFYPSFKQSPLYVHMLAELDLLKEPSYSKFDDVETESSNSSPTGSLNVSLNNLSGSYYDKSFNRNAFISNTRVHNEQGKIHTVYTITVLKRNWDGSKETWETNRSFSDFQDFHMSVTKHFKELSINKMNMDVLENNKNDFNAYLKLLLSPEMAKACPTLNPYISDFLENKTYSKDKGEFARKIATFLRPLLSSKKNISNAVKAPGMTEVSDMSQMSERLGQDFRQSTTTIPPLLPNANNESKYCPVSSKLDDNVGDMIPFRVMLLLMEEVFDLKEKNQWLQNNIKKLLWQLIRATYGDTINRKIVDHINHLTSPEQVANYIKTFKDSHWPDGILKETLPLRDKSIRLRTRVAAKTCLLGIMPDELKHITGAETTRKGILCVFDMFQHQTMNRRLFYVFLESFLKTMFPQYKFSELFEKVLSRSPRVQRCRKAHP